MKRKVNLLMAALLALVFALGLCLNPALAGAAENDGGLVYFENGTIYTADAEDTVVEALAMEDGRIVFVGSAEDGRTYRDAAAEIVDLKDGMLLPGLIDGHIHSASPDFFDFSLIGIETAEETLAAIEAYVEANPDKETYCGYGYMATLFEGDEFTNGPKKERLDEISPDKPLMIYSFDGHAAWLNSKAFEYCGVNKDTKSTPGGAIVLDDEGELWGTLQDSAMSFTADFPLDQEKLGAALKDFVHTLNAYGYTTIFTPPGNGFLPLPLTAYQKLADDGELNLRVRGSGIVTTWQTEDDIATLSELSKKYDSELLKVIGAKLFTDGVVDNESAYMLEPYEDNPDYYGEAGWEQQALNEAAAAVNELGLLTHFHAIGDAAVRMALDAVEYTEEQLGVDDYRAAITHLQVVDPEDFPRFAELGVTAVVDPYWHLKEPGYWEGREHASLGERAEREYPMKSFIDNSALLAVASDYPVTTAPNPFHAIEAGVTRNLVDGSKYGLPDITDMDDPTYLLNADERVSVIDMLRGFTINNAYAIFEEDETGSLEVGKSADMIVIDQDLLTIDPLDISETQVLRTYLKGKLVYGEKAKPEPEPTMDVVETEKPVEEEKAQAVTLEMETNPTTGFDWTVSIEGDGKMEMVKSSFVEEGEDIAGSPHTVTYVLFAKSPGSVKASFTYERDWEGGERLVRHTYEFVIDEALQVTLKDANREIFDDAEEDTLPKVAEPKIGPAA